MTTLMAIGGCAAGAAAFGVIFWRCRVSLKRSRLVAGESLAEHYRRGRDERN